MARTALSVVELSPNNSTAATTGTAGTTDGHSINVAPEELILRVVITNAETDVTIKGGTYPPALSAGQGDLVESLAVGTHWMGPFTSARFLQSDGTVWINYETAANVAVTALHIPRTA